MIPAMKHRLKVSFPTEGEAIQAALDHAAQAVSKGDVGL
jgi:hypothetical protein